MGGNSEFVSLHTLMETIGVPVVGLASGGAELLTDLIPLLGLDATNRRR